MDEMLHGRGGRKEGRGREKSVFLAMCMDDDAADPFAFLSFLICIKTRGMDDDPLARLQ